jgi:hypothetical protein
MHADEKWDEAIVLTKRPNKGRQLLAEVVEGRASPKGNSRQAAVVSDTEPSCHVDPIGGCAPDCTRRQTAGRQTFDRREEPGALAAHAGICAGGEEKSSSLPRRWRRRGSHPRQTKFLCLCDPAFFAQKQQRSQWTRVQLDFETQVLHN